MRRLGEIALISDFLAPLASHPGAFGLKDDAALLTGLPASGLVVTADALVAGVHFFEDDDPGDAAYKALAVNMSDLAAKAARPLAYTMTLALTEAPTEAWAQRFTAGLARAQETFGIALIGGDTVSARGAWWLSITAFGEASPRGLVPRGGAQPGDYLYVSGTLGDAALGLQLRLRGGAFGPPLAPAHREFLLKRYLYPEPRLCLAQALADEASAAMDISDGLALDLTRMCSASQVSAEVPVSQVPLSEAAQAIAVTLPSAVQAVLTGGDDYEILAAVPPGRAAAFESASLKAGVPVTRIGFICEGSEPPKFKNPDGSVLDLAVKGFEHFKA
ncbi:MAG: thiamine-phosphate kinase [Rhodomicrobium sp.]|nr:thiamine-phosphate kinase [Rhodomicrobium sp.]